MRIIAVDYYEYFLCAIDNGNKLILYNLKTLMKLFILDLKPWSEHIYDELIFGKLSLSLFALTYSGKIMHFQINVNHFDYTIEMKTVYELDQPIVKMEPDLFLEDVLYVAHEQSFIVYKSNSMN
jgi:hypothetical protein